MIGGQPDFDYFESQVDRTFTMRLGPEASTPLRLVSCVRSEVAGGTSSFTLEFSGGPDAPAEQGTYVVSPPGSDGAADSSAPEDTPIFLVPLRQTPTGVDYLAVFNQLAISNQLDEG